MLRALSNRFGFKREKKTPYISPTLLFNAICTRSRDQTNYKKNKQFKMENFHVRILSISLFKNFPTNFFSIQFSPYDCEYILIEGKLKHSAHLLIWPHNILDPVQKVVHTCVHTGCIQIAALLGK